MTAPPDRRVDRLLFLELLNAGLIPTDAAYDPVRVEVWERGALEWEGVRAAIPGTAWDEANGPLDRPLRTDDCHRILGFGWWMTRFLAAPVEPDPAVADEVARLGALANFVVTAFDYFLDAGAVTPSGPPARPTAEAILGSLGGASPAGAVVQALARRYFDLLGRLPHASGRAEVVDLVGTAIARMYEAELLLSRRSEAPEGLLRRKAALPFVVMGLPAWLAVPDVDRSSCAWHLRWAYQLGAFVGWLDDAIDLEQDRAAGAPNAVARALGRPGTDERRLAERIAGAGARCLDEWRARVPPGTAGPAVERVLSCVVYSWFGATRTLAR